MISEIKIIYFGTSEFAVPALRYLVQNGYSIIAVVTQPEKPVGRAKVVFPSPVKKTALELNIPVFEPHNLKHDEDFFNSYAETAPDLCIVSAYGKLIPKRYLDLPRYGFLNIHPSLLPKYRGPSPIQTAIMNGDQETGVAVMKLDEGMDSGPILEVTDYKLSTIRNYKDIEKELAEFGGRLLLNVLPKYISGELRPIEQDNSKATITHLFGRDDGRIDWNRTAREIFNQIRALGHEPGVWCLWKNKAMNIVEAEVFDGDSMGLIGEVVRIDNRIAVKTIKCYLILKQIQLEGGKKMDATSFVNGHSDFLGSVLE